MLLPPPPNKKSYCNLATVLQAHTVKASKQTLAAPDRAPGWNEPGGKKLSGREVKWPASELSELLTHSLCELVTARSQEHTCKGDFGSATLGERRQSLRGLRDRGQARRQAIAVEGSGLQLTD